ncbi:hypothetical protein B0H67DRAFT_683656 [Lasiosphaeris hirsuta]|uniref:Uncharacterized protein n=1 Tax=Lasiosphaeris hirsuta TaxID=260670 RepID=A0AA40DTY5_9PEZI|nr:hypothetical protein B0H67DRAFT_683656 [Lasiosphaeris hirsuta]
MPSQNEISPCPLQHIIDQLEQQRMRVASMRLLALDEAFYHGLASGGDVVTLRQVGRLFQCLMETSYACGFSKPVDKAVNSLLLHATKGCEKQSSHSQSLCGGQDSLRWLPPSEIEMKDLVEGYRSFANYITSQDASHQPRDRNLTEVRRRLQKLSPKINNVATWRHCPDPDRSPDTPSRNTRLSKATWKSPTPTYPTHDTQSSTSTSSEMDSSIWSPSPSGYASGGHDTDFTTPTQEVDSCPKYLFTPPENDGKSPPAQFRLFNGMLEEVTQPFDSGVALSENGDAAAKRSRWRDQQQAPW